MAFNLLTGVMGAGKTHEAVDLLIQHVRKRRRIVTNISGLDVDKISELVGFDASPFVTVTSVERVLEQGFFPTEAQVEKLHMDVPTIVKPGDLVVLDEVWRYWPGGKAPSADAMDFFRMHRHFADPATGQTCDIVVLIQDVSSLNKLIKDLVEIHFQCKKHRALGADNRYLVKQFEGATTRRALMVNSWQKKYDPKIFALYKSHTVAGAKETNIDKRSVLWRDKKFIATVVFGLLAITVVPIWLVHSFKKSAGIDDTKSTLTATTNPSSGSTPQAQGQAAGHVPATDAAAAPVAPSIPLRVAGSVRGPDGSTWSIVDDGKAIRLVPQGVLTGTGVGSYGMVDGKKASTWGGSIPATRTAPAGKSGGIL